MFIELLLQRLVGDAKSANPPYITLLHLLCGIQRFAGHEPLFLGVLQILHDAGLLRQQGFESVFLLVVVNGGVGQLLFKFGFLLLQLAESGFPFFHFFFQGAQPLAAFGVFAAAGFAGFGAVFGGGFAVVGRIGGGAALRQSLPVVVQVAVEGRGLAVGHQNETVAHRAQ